ncbi:HotDog domain-containing protein [Sparassis latifolia]
MLAARALGRRAAAYVRPSRHTPNRSLSTSTDPSSSSSSSLFSWSSAFRYLRNISTISTLAVTSYTVGSLYPPTLATYVSPRTAPPPPHPEDPSYIAYASALEDTLQNLPKLNDLRTREDADEWYETRPYVNVPEERRVNSLTAGALWGPGKFALPPLVRCRKDNRESWNFVHVGRGVCGHEGIVHGGLLATLLDEGLGRMALLNLPEKMGVTAYLNLSYRAPTRADQFVVVKTHLIEAKGRKSKVRGRIEDMDGNVLVEAEALFIQPKYAKILNTQQMRDMLSEPSDSPNALTEATVAPVPVALSTARPEAQA